MKKFVLSLLSFIALVLVMSKTAYAYGPDFDPEYYASHNPDVVAVYGGDPESLYRHYLEYGYGEGRYKNATEESTGIITNIITPVQGYDTYIDVSIDFQTVTYFEQGEIKFQAPCVTGNVKTSKETPKGTFSVMSKVPGKRLKGPTWNCWVNRWMQFTKSACGFHDASWRKSFGGDIYKTNGSHGCVNMSKSDAYTLYDLISVGTIVIVH